jgi:hypothetical protein
LLWPALAEGATQGELEQRLVEAYAIDAVTAAGDVEAFVSVLAEHELLAP